MKIKHIKSKNLFITKTMNLENRIITLLFGKINIAILFFSMIIVSGSTKQIIF